MIKNIRILFFVLILSSISKNSLGLNSAAYLISQSAFKNYDFSTVLLDFNLNEKIKNNSNLVNELISAVIIEDLSLGNKISKEILSNDQLHIESRLLTFINFIINNKGDKIKKTIENYNLENYGLNIAESNDNIIVDTLDWKGNAKKSGLEMDDIISEIKIENFDRPNKDVIYIFSFFALLLFIALITDFITLDE